MNFNSWSRIFVAIYYLQLNIQGEFQLFDRMDADIKRFFYSSFLLIL